MMGRRKLVLSVLGLGAAGGSVAAWRGKHSLPPRDPAAEERFRVAQAAVIAASGAPIVSRFVDVREPAVRAQLLEVGQGDPVLLVHGGNGVAAGWMPLLTRLSPRFHLYAPDRPGCGLTSQFLYLDVVLRAHGVALVGSMLDALGLERAALVGNSMGGFFSLAFALAHPERVSKLVLIGEVAGSGEHFSMYHRLVGTRGVNTLLYATAMRPGDAAKTRATLTRGGLVADVRRIPDDLIECFTAGAHLPGAVESWLTMVERAFRPAGAGLFTNDTTLTHALRGELKTLAPPTLFLWGEKDPLGPPSRGRELAALMPNGRAVEVPDAGHLPWLDQPEFCARHIEEFLA